MCNIPKRAFQRETCQARIFYSDYGNKKQLFEAQLYNASEGGMYFEAADSVQPGADLFIKLSDCSSELQGIESYDGYRAEVMWCRKIYKEDTAGCYGVGVRFMVNTCSHCGEKVAYSDIHKTDSFLFLCSRCLKHLQMLPDGKLKDSVEKFLLGNVV